ncbi:hypothetical protein DD237_002608 [Peronospora effusa]|uniref:RxLR effector protein n=1 Tax=Peronospora effusa TaxID=542832 RepID=A0A425CP81_9STRA|nr:hypothetical protein DD237_002608 [Peronospora effusa]
MRLYCTVLVVAAVALVNTNDLVDGAVKKRRLGLKDFFGGASSSTKYTSLEEYMPNEKAFAEHADMYERSMKKLFENDQIENLKSIAKSQSNQKLYDHFLNYYNQDEGLFLKNLQEVKKVPEPKFVKEFRLIFFNNWKNRGLSPENVEAIAGEYWAFLYRRDMK